jgi:hypothetical protein
MVTSLFAKEGLRGISLPPFAERGLRGMALT